MFVVPLIERKRDGGALTPEEWSALVAAYTAGRVPDYQMSALLMAVYFRGLERPELAALTDAMLASGQRLAFDGWATPRIDKLASEIAERGFTLVPLSLYFTGGRAKVELALARGKRTYDKRQDLAQRDAAPRIERPPPISRIVSPGTGTPAFSSITPKKIAQ